MTVPHASPHRERVDHRVLLAALAAGPTGWIFQLVAGYAVASTGCARLRAAGAASVAALSREPGLLIAINLVCLSVILAGGIFCRVAWSRVSDEKGGGPEATLTIGEGRTRFVAVCGMLSSVVFTLAVLFNTVEPLLVGGCWTGIPA